MRQPAAQPPPAWKKPPAYELHEDAKTWQVIDGVELDQLIGSFRPDQIVKDWLTAVRVVQAFKMDHNEGSMRGFGWEWYKGKVCKKFKCGKDASGAAYAWVRFDGDGYDCKVYVHRVAQAWRRRLPRAPGAACLRRRLVKSQMRQVRTQ